MKLNIFIVAMAMIFCGISASAQNVKKVHMITELKADTTLVCEYPKGEAFISTLVQFTAANPQAGTSEEHVYLWETRNSSQAVVVRNVPGRWLPVSVDKPLHEVYFLSSEGKKILIAFKEEDEQK